MYAGSKWARDANPDILMKEGGYHTSSPEIKKIIKNSGLESFEIVDIIEEYEIKIPFGWLNIYEYETYFLQSNDIAKKENWINKHNNTSTIALTSKYWKTEDGKRERSKQRLRYLSNPENMKKHKEALILMNKRQDVREKRSKAMCGANNSFYNKKHTKESLEKISNKRRGKNSWNAIAIELILFDNTIENFRSMNEFYKKTGICRTLFNREFILKKNKIICNSHTKYSQYIGAILKF